MITYPKIPSESVVFREKFTNGTYVADNGGTLTGAPSIDKGIVLNGTSQYVGYDFNFDDLDAFSIECVFVPGTVAGTWHPLVANGLQANSGVMLSQNGDRILFLIPNVAYESLVADDIELQAGETYHVVATFDGTNGLVYVNGQLDTATRTFTKVSSGGDHTVIGASAAAAPYNCWSSTYLEGEIKGVSIYDKVLTQEEVTDRFTQQTFQEIKPENSEIWLPLRTHYFDSGVSKEVVPNLGNINSDQIWWGNGVDAATQPTQLSPNGIYCASGASPDYVRTPKTFTTTVGESYSFSCLAQPTGTLAGNDYLFSVKQSLSEGLSLAILAANGKMTFFCGGGTGLVDDDSMGQGAGLYHIAVVLEYNGVNYDTYLYKDGELVDSSLGHAGFTPAAGNAMIAVGADYDGGQGFQGNIHFPIFARMAWTPTQVKQLSDYSYRNLNL